MAGEALMNISAREACERLLSEAIRGHYLGQDELAVHVLAWSAFSVARDLVRHDYPERDQTARFLTKDPKLRKVFWDGVRRLRNFLHHAGKDAPREIEVNSVGLLNDLLIKLAVYEYYTAMGRRNLLATLVFVHWTDASSEVDTSKLPDGAVADLERARSVGPGLEVARIVRDLATDAAFRANAERVTGLPYV